MITNPIDITEIPEAGQIKLDWYPEFASVWNPNAGEQWAAAVIESASVADPGMGGDYATIIKITGGDEETGILDWILVRGTADDVIVGNTLVLYNIFEIGWDLRRTPVFEPGAAAWRESDVSAGPVFRRSDSKYIMLINGVDTSGNNSVGAIESDDLVTWTVMNGDAAIFTPAASPWGCDSLYASGAPIWMPTQARYIIFVSFRVAGVWNIGWIKFSANFAEITYSASACTSGVALPAGGSGIASPSVAKNGAVYSMLYVARLADVQNWEVREAESVQLDGLDYTGDATVQIAKDQTNDEIYHSSHIDALLQFNMNGERHLIAGGTSLLVKSGSKGNRIYGVFTWDTDTSAWMENEKNPVFYNPMGASVPLWGADLEWAQDHCGGYPQLIYNQPTNTLYLFLSMINGASGYRVAQFSKTLS